MENTDLNIAAALDQLQQMFQTLSEIQVLNKQTDEALDDLEATLNDARELVRNLTD